MQEYQIFSNYRLRQLTDVVSGFWKCISSTNVIQQLQVLMRDCGVGVYGLVCRSSAVTNFEGMMYTTAASKASTPMYAREGTTVDRKN